VDAEQWAGEYEQSAPSGDVYNAANNQNPNFSYDAAGNQTTFGSLTLSYDAENRQWKMVDMGGGTGTFQYDGLGHRVVKVLPSLTTTYVYDGFGQMAAEYYSGTALPRPPCSTCYLSYDYLGSVRMVTDAGANVVARHDFAPFGQEIASGVNGRGSAWGSISDVDAKFTGQVRDQESGLDFFNARYFAASLGRFSSPDPGNAGASLGDSQSWNGYAYAVNNPLRFVDPSGQNCIYVGPRDGDLNDPNNYVDDENGGETCAQAFDPTDNNTVSATVYDSLSGLPVRARQQWAAGQTLVIRQRTGHVQIALCQRRVWISWIGLQRQTLFWPPITILRPNLMAKQMEQLWL
jgi:RHS repeat-associated protein